MKLALNVFKVVPSKTTSLIDKVGVSDSIAEDVASFMVDDNAIFIKYNNGTEDLIPLRNNGEGNEDWRGFNLFVTRKFLEIDLSK